MKVKTVVRKQIFEIIKNQINNNDPAETKLTYNRLIGLGYSDFEANQFIGQCVVVEIFDIMKHGKLFDEQRYIKNLKRLPEKPFD